MRKLILCALLCSAAILRGQETDNPLATPLPGATCLRILSSNLLELELVTLKKPDPAPVPQWNFIDSSFHFQAPAAGEFSVRAGGRVIAASVAGFKRRPLFAPLKKRDLRVWNDLYLKLDSPLTAGERVEVSNPSQRLWTSGQRFAAVFDPQRWSPAIHVNEEGYTAAWPKMAMVGYFLGSAGEMEIPGAGGFNLIDAHGATVFHGPLTLRPDQGYTYTPRPYQNVWQADFTGWTNAGIYRVQVPGLGASYPFAIDEGIAADFARTYALGLYHQRCGCANELPFTRFTKAACHVAPAEVPDMSFQAVNEDLANMTSDFHDNPRHTAPQLKSIDASLYPFVRKGKIDVSGGHHDAGDYSKYTINVAQLIHELVFAADAFPGAGALDNLGIPESGDGKSDLLEEAKWEADFLVKMQDDDGGFYFLVYPRDREYEDNVSLLGRDTGDPQVVFPKTTGATAAAVAALAQMSASPLFKQQFPAAAASYLAHARKGWDFLQRAIAKFGRDGSYQKITHYGDEFMHDDELTWAETEMFLATGDAALQKQIIADLRPTDSNQRRWTWWRLFESYGCATRSFAFGARTRRLPADQLDQILLGQCEDEIIAAADDAARDSAENAYGTSFPEASKRFQNAGWYFSLDRAFDLAVAYQLNFPKMNDPRPKYLAAILENMNYVGGCNPVNQPFVTGVGWRRQQNIVNQYSENARRLLPPTGIDVGNIQEGFMYMDNYKKELSNLTFPTDWDAVNPFPFYDRWADSFNTATESVTADMGRGLATTSFLMAQTPLARQPWRAASAHLEVVQASPVEALLKADGGLDLRSGRCLWEAGGEPVIHKASAPFLAPAGARWIEAEAWWPDGRRVFVSTNLN
ncbi:MAG TPA: glycoside hydrolase family 9 protein [Verrucomicrobiae bacterium]|jgi:hypothetical protein|nr:glycoside hydrolase family 9 protein [Verrucomicrobiae bacterium]